MPRKYKVVDRRNQSNYPTGYQLIIDKDLLHNTIVPVVYADYDVALGEAKEILKNDEANYVKIMEERVVTTVEKA